MKEVNEEGDHERTRSVALPLAHVAVASSFIVAAAPSPPMRQSFQLGHALSATHTTLSVACAMLYECV